MTKIYEAEMMRHNISPRQFFSYCKRELAKRTGHDIEEWVEYESWVNPYMPCNYRSGHEDWDEPRMEICKYMSYDYHLYLEKSYNFIMEFDFDDDNSGWGYMYCVEWDE